MVIDLGSFSILFTVFWIVGITNSINLVDGIDGLASGLILLFLRYFEFYLSGT